MSKRGPGIEQEERLAIVQEGEKTSFNAVCAKYNISRETYRRWRYAARGIKPKPYRRFSPQQKLEILEEGYQCGIGVACKRWGIDPSVYNYWKQKFHYTKSRRIKQEERLAIVQEGEKTSSNAVCAKYNISPQTYRRWRYAARGIKPKPARHFPDRRKLQILEEGYQNGIGVACKRWGIDPSVYFYWKHKFNFTKSRPRCLHTFPRFSTEQKLAILKEGEKTSAIAVARKYGFDRHLRGLAIPALGNPAEKTHPGQTPDARNPRRRG